MTQIPAAKRNPGSTYTCRIHNVPKLNTLKYTINWGFIKGFRLKIKLA
ncbi:hypothetical protein C5L31_000517 [Secundilactobacillus malefermentans]|uniref:Uncharacterized protein n=1 Tax=Secundilactobacillus malefermentans TaxID=176292 RepID=A0A4R5NQA0_9LACO|nr:hypothetical protein C5L31_000517 [Secundilactobacillus malefermentans]